MGELMESVIVYWSRYGNGKKLVDYLDDKLKENKIETKIFKTDEANPTSMPDADFYVFSAPSEAFSIQRNMKKFMKKLEGMENKKYGLINTHGMDRSMIHKMEKILSKKNMKKVAEVDFKVGNDAKNGNGFIEDFKPKMDEFVGKL